MKSKRVSKNNILAMVFILGAILAIRSACAYAAGTVQDQDIITADEVRAIVQEAYPGYTIGEIELENDKGASVYDVEVADKDGVPYDVEIDPVSGAILKIQIDDYRATGKIVKESEDDDAGEDD